MSCRRVSRELIERFRFGEELDARSAPHLAHLETCIACREEVGLNRALVRQLRRALHDRIEGYGPSEHAWQVVSARALAADRTLLARVRDRLTGLRPVPVANALRASALALALVMAVFAGGIAQIGTPGSAPVAAVNATRADSLMPTAWLDPSQAPELHRSQFQPPFPGPPQSGLTVFSSSTLVVRIPADHPIVTGLMR
jgi:anti-sigma factor RsiW